MVPAVVLNGAAKKNVRTVATDRTVVVQLRKNSFTRAILNSLRWAVNKQ
jgi:RNA-binding protein YhbY